MASDQKNQLIEQYLYEPQALSRLKLLASLKKQSVSIPLELAADLMLLDLPISEKQAILSVTDSSDPLEFEKFLTDNLATASQELATSYINTWTAKSSHLLGYRMQRVATARHTPQRVRYTILSSAWHVGGKELIQKFANLDGLEELSQAFHALLLEKAVAWNIDQPRLLKVAKTISNDLREELHPSNKALSAALYYLARFHPNELDSIRKDQFLSSSWQALVQSLNLDQDDDYRQKPSKTTRSFDDLWQSWPPIWQRSRLGTDTIYAAMQIAANEHNHPRNNIFQGVDQDKLTEAWKRCTEKEKQQLSERFLSGYLEVEEALRYKNIPNKSVATAFVKDDTKKYLMTEEITWIAQRAQSSDRQLFFDSTYRNRKLTNDQVPKAEPWKTLFESYQNKSDEQIDKLVALADQSHGVFKLCFLNVLGSFKGSDRAVLKLLGYLRSTEDHELESMIQALGDIGTARAGQELLKVMLRPSLNQAAQIKIIRCLEKMETEGLQTELRGAIAEIQTLPMGSAEKDELTESLASLLITTNNSPVEVDASVSAQSTFATDEYLTQLIPCYGKLSGEVKRALRTGQFFHNQVRAHQNSSSIDLSPVIDMQYKALEIYLRESFENYANQLIHDGVLQRKLDIIGYARPIPEKMTAFENYVGNHPIVREIPFFSKFKLRKMLRGLCQFKPGKRFTLDGLKAFSLFFLCFSRKKCTYGLANLMPMPFPSDQQLALFCKQLHIFQDFRNRAVHEGLPPGAANNIEMTWKETAEIIVQINNLNSILEHVKAQTRVAPAEVIIERKGA